MGAVDAEPPLGKLDGLALLLPAWQPEPALVALVSTLLECGFGAAVVVDDGSHGCHETFERLTALPRVHRLRHAVNRGKGRALKTAISYCFRQLPEFHGAVTADADGQHTVADIVRVGEALLVSGGRAVLGAREFGGGVPLRSRLGNTLARGAFALATGTRLRDTQTGLRGFPRSMLPELMVLEGERYEYEAMVLAHLCLSGRRPVDVSIETVYLDHNRNSHFHPLRDSMRIVGAMARLATRKNRK